MRTSSLLLVLLVLPAAVVVRAPAEAGADEIARGAYLVHHVTRCFTCHSERDWRLFSGPIVAGTEGRGGVVGLFGSKREAPPITPGALARWSAADLAAALRAGELPGSGAFHRDFLLDGLFALTPADAAAIASYLVASPAEVGEPPPADGAPPESSASAARGRYLVQIARCAWCHGETLAEGREIELPLGASHPAANITLHPTAGIGRLDRAGFIDYFKSLDGPDFQRVPVPPGELNTAMPWPWIAGMTREDLGAIYDYLRTVPVVP